MPFKKCNSIDSNCKPTFWRKNQSKSLWFLWKVAPSISYSSWSCLYPSADDQSLPRSSRVTALIYWVCLFLESSDGLDLLGTTTRSSFQYQASHNSSFLSDDDHRSQCNGRGMRGATNLTRNSKIILLWDKGHIWDGFLFIKGTCFILEGLIWGVLWKAKSA